MTLELNANLHRYCMYSWQLLSLTNGSDHVLFRLLFSPSSRPMHVYSWKDHIILMLEHGKCHLLSMYAFKQSLHKQYINSMESRTVTRERGKPVVNLCAVTDVPAYSLSQNMCVSYTDRSGIHINKQMFRFRVVFHWPFYSTHGNTMVLFVNVSICSANIAEVFPKQKCMAAGFVSSNLDIQASFY